MKYVIMTSSFQRLTENSFMAVTIDFKCSVLVGVGDQNYFKKLRSTVFLEKGLKFQPIRIQKLESTVFSILIG